ncbi:MAG: magnesium transporter CorA family protein [Candidatus Bathyarchaeota archaeon]|nr:magnesium transporter CorA family protein [Candidatus Bathyarchaeota archaeon]
MIRAVFMGDNSERPVTAEELSTLPVSNVWLEVVDPTDAELDAVAATVHVPVTFLRLPKNGGVVELRVEEGYGIIDFLVMADVVSTKKAYPIVLVFSKKFLVTVSKKEIQPVINLAKERMSKTKNDPPAQVTYFIIDEIVANHYVDIEKLETLTAKMEEEVVEKASSETLKRIFKLKTNMVRFNKILWYERSLIFNLRRCSDACMDAKYRSLFDITHEDLTRQIDIVETYREILSDAINVYLSSISNKINLSIQALTVVIFYLTIITTVTSFPNTVATFFGISQFGNTHFGIVIIALLLSIVLPFVWLWRKKWLKPKPVG